MPDVKERRVEGRVVLFMANISPQGALYKSMSHFWLWARIQLLIEIAQIN